MNMNFHWPKCELYIIGPNVNVWDVKGQVEGPI